MIAVVLLEVLCCAISRDHLQLEWGPDIHCFTPLRGKGGGGRGRGEEGEGEELNNGST